MAENAWLGEGGTVGDYQVAANWSAGWVPMSTDNVRIPPSSTVPITANLNNSATALGDFIVQRGYQQSIGTAPTTSALPVYLQVDPNRFEFAGGGLSYINIGSAAIDAVVNYTRSASPGNSGLYLLGSAISELSVNGGNVGLASTATKTSTVTTASVNKQGSKLTLGEGVTATTTLCYGGTLIQRCNCTALEVYGGTVYLEEEASPSTLTIYGGTVYWNSNATISNVYLYGGTLDTTQASMGRTISVLYLSTGELRADKDLITVSTLTLNNQKPVRITSVDL